MNKRKIVLLALGLALWGASSFVMFKTTAPINHAYAQSLTTTATASGTQVTVSWNKIPDAAHYQIFREPSVSGTFTPLFSTLNGDTTTYTDSPGDGSYIYRVDALKTDSTTVTGFPTSAVTVNSAVAPSPAPGASTPAASSFLSGDCAGTVTAAKTAAESAAKNTASQGIYETIDSEGVKTVFRWTLSLVNLLVLFFLLIIAFANILRIDVDTYALQKVFVPLILGVLLANFSWLICRFFIEISTILYHALVDPFGGGAGLFAKIASRGYGFDQICATAHGTGIGVGATLLGSFVGTALILVAGILILTLYVLLVARVWIVTLLIVLSPLAFLSLGFPMTQQYFKKWWSVFFNWVFMAPASFLILVLAYQMTNISKEPSLTKFILITALLYYAVQVPFKMGGEWMTKWGGYVSQFKQKSGQLATTAADKSTKGLREGASKNIQRFAWDTRLGQRIAAGQKRRELKTAVLDTNLTNAKGRGQLSYLESKKGLELGKRLAHVESEKALHELSIKTAKETNVSDAEKAFIDNDPAVIAARAKLKAGLSDGESIRYKAAQDAVAERKDNLQKTFDRDPRFASLDVNAKKKRFDEMLNRDLEYQRVAAELARIDPGVKVKVNTLEKTVHDAEVEASKKTAVARADVITIKPTSAKDIAEIKSLYSQSDTGIQMDHQRAFWGSYIKAEEAKVEHNLNDAFYRFFRDDPEARREDFAKKAGVTTQQVQDTLTRFAKAQVDAASQKNLMENEGLKAQTVIVERYLRPQNLKDQVEIKARSLDIITTQLKKLETAIRDGTATTEQRENYENLGRKQAILTREHTDAGVALGDWEDKTHNRVGGKIEALSETERDSYKLDETGHIRVVSTSPRRKLDNWRSTENSTIDLIATSRAKNRTEAEHVNELEGKGNDVKGLRADELIPALMSNDQKTITEIMLANPKEDRLLQHGQTWLRSGMQLASKPEGGLMREYLINKLDPNGLAKLAASVAESKNTRLKPQVELAKAALNDDGEIRSPEAGEAFRSSLLKTSGVRGEATEIMRRFQAIMFSPGMTQ